MDDPCKLGFNMDIGACGKSIALGLVPDWVWSLLNALPWIFGTIIALLVLYVLIRAYQFGGWIAVAGVIGVVAGGAGGYFLTRKKAAPPPPPRQPRNKRKRRGGFSFPMPAPGRKRRFNADTSLWEWIE